MPDEIPAETKLSAVAIARDWGVRRQYASKMIAAGCPTGSFEAAREWRAARSPRGTGYRSHSKTPDSAPNLPVSEVEAGISVRAALEKKEGEGGGQSEPPLRKDAENGQPEFVVESKDLSARANSLLAAIEVEQEAHRLVKVAQLGGLDSLMVPRIGAYTKAQAGRMDAESAVFDLKEREGILVRLDEAKALINRAFGPLIARIRALPRNMALKVNPLDDAHAERLLTEECERILLEVRDEAYAPAA